MERGLNSVVTHTDMEPIAPRAEVTVYSPLFSPFRQQLQGTAVSIGRASDCSIPIKDRYLSRKHAEIVVDRGSWILKDCGSADGTSFVNVEVRREDKTDTSELRISHTVLNEVVHEKKALAFMDVSMDEKLSRAQSIIMQGIRSILCAPLMIGDAVVGVLYVDYLFNQRKISEDDVRLVAQIARFAAIKLETTRLRDEAIQKRIMDEELKTASVIQRRLLPPAPTGIAGYTFAEANRPCRTVSDD